MKFDSGFKYRMSKKKYIFHSDPGHGWFAVRLTELAFLKIADKISAYSYVKGDTAYLEEDCDAGLFFKAYEEVFGKKPEYKESYLERTPIRYYNPYSFLRVDMKLAA
jgi:hypothetical protein